MWDKNDTCIIRFEYNDLLIIVEALNEKVKELNRLKFKHSDKGKKMSILKGQLQEVVNRKELIYDEKEVAKALLGDYCENCD